MRSLIRTLLAALLWAAARMSTFVSASTDDDVVHFLCWRGSSEYEYELVFCDDEDGDPENTIDEWYCFKSVVCQDWRNNNRKCPIVKGCATESQCKTDSGALMEEDVQIVGALNITTWCALADNSNDHAGLSLRTPTNNADSAKLSLYQSVGKWMSLAPWLMVAAYCTLS